MRVSKCKLSSLDGFYALQLAHCKITKLFRMLLIKFFFVKARSLVLWICNKFYVMGRIYWLQF